MLVHLVRHGEVDNPQGLVYGALPRFGLSIRGQRQAELAARHLADRPIAAVWSSPLERALRTAEVIAHPHGLAVKVDNTLVEWDHQGWTGLRWDHLPVERPGQLEAYLADPTQLDFAGESLDELARRIEQAIGRAADITPGELVVVGHQDPLQAGLLQLTGRPLHQLHQDPPQHASIITLRPGTPWIELGRWLPEG
ncbi:MAG TPA: histidine phosphatase family protein [Acidimicrobiia bacterium]|nr:histidine phosphatase family protein [Acidimicrobiia bacterium]